MRRCQTFRFYVMAWSTFVIGVAGGAVVLVGCSADARSRAMHFFFEYPPPESPKRAAGAQPEVAGEVVGEAPKPAARFASRHAPFVQRACQSCHVAGAGQAPRPDFVDKCRECHEAKFAYHRFGHAPVVAQDCRFCHSMHTSRYAALLNAPQATMCTTCHAAQQDDAALTSYHKGIDGMACTSCHDPHFADNPLLLKPEEVRRALGEGRSIDAGSEVHP